MGFRMAFCRRRHHERNRFSGAAAALLQLDSLPYGGSSACRWPSHRQPTATGTRRIGNYPEQLLSRLGRLILFLFRDGDDFARDFLLPALPLLEISFRSFGRICFVLSIQPTQGGKLLQQSHHLIGRFTAHRTSGYPWHWMERLGQRLTVGERAGGNTV